MKVSNIVMTYNTNDAEKIPIAKNWQDRKDLYYMQTLTKKEKEACKTFDELFDTLTENLKQSITKPSYLHKLQAM